MNRRERLAQSLDAIRMPEETRNRIRAGMAAAPPRKASPALAWVGASAAAVLVFSLLCMGVWRLYHMEIPSPLASEAVSAPAVEVSDKPFTDDELRYGERLIETYFSALNDKDWESYLSVLDPQERAYRRRYINDTGKQKTHAGLHNVKSARVISIRSISQNTKGQERQVRYQVKLEVEAVDNDAPDSGYTTGEHIVYMRLNATGDEWYILSSEADWNETPNPYGIVDPYKQVTLTDDEWAWCVDKIWREFSARKKASDERMRSMASSMATVNSYPPDDEYVYPFLSIASSTFVSDQEYVVSFAELLDRAGNYAYEAYKAYQPYGYDAAVFLVEYSKADQPNALMYSICVLVKENGLWQIHFVMNTEGRIGTAILMDSPLVLGTVDWNIGDSGSAIPVTIRRKNKDSGLLYADFFHWVGYYCVPIEDYGFMAYRFSAISAQLDENNYEELIFLMETGVGQYHVTILSMKVTDGFNNDIIHLPVPGDGGGYTVTGKLQSDGFVNCGVKETGLSQSIGITTDSIFDENEFSQYYAADGSLLQEGGGLEVSGIHSVNVTERGTVEITQQLWFTSPTLNLGYLVTELKYDNSGECEIVSQRFLQVGEFDPDLKH